MGTQNITSVIAKYLTGVIAGSRKQDAICSKWNGMYENNVNVMVREAFLFMVTVYSKHFPPIKKNISIVLMLTRQKVFLRCRLHLNCLLTHSLK